MQLKCNLGKKAEDSSPHQLSDHFLVRQLPKFCCSEMDYIAIASVTASDKDPSFD
ncbi:MAG: hypothetical protein RMZ69_21050 [Nostoc sp. ChiQUE01a]|nr:hypothetical protein [Nostoc sp. ChiQUE01a]